MLRRVGEIVDAVAVPVSADLEEGFGEAPGDGGGHDHDGPGRRGRAAATSRTSPASGPARCSTRRSRRTASAPPGPPSTPRGEPFVLVGRTDALLVGGSLSEAVDRANAYLAAGADCAFVPGAADAATIGTLVRELDGPLNVVMGLTGNALSLDDLRELGVRRVTVGGSIARAMYRHLQRAAQELAAAGHVLLRQDQLSQTDLNELFRTT